MCEPDIQAIGGVCLLELAWEEGERHNPAVVAFTRYLASVATMTWGENSRVEQVKKKETKTQQRYNC